MNLRILKSIWPIMVIICLFPCGLFPADIFVTTTADSGQGSFRDAILQSLISPEPDVILFQITKSDPGYNADMGVWTIMATRSYTITDTNLVINGMSQSEFIGEDTNPNGPEIELKGSSMQGNNGIFIKTSGVQIFYLTINEFEGAGIYLDEAADCHIAGCYIGTDPTGTEARGNTYGIYVDDSMHNHIVPMDSLPNVISGNPWVGITLGFGSSHNIVVGNVIGLNAAKSDTLGNGLIGGYGGVNISDSSNHNEVYGNWIMGNKVGVHITESSHNTVANNFIGANDTWQLQFGNIGTGISIRTYSDSATNNLIMENVIGFNGFDGISVEGSMAIRNTLTRNSISGNGAMGIFNYQGGNTELPPPVIQSVSGSQVTGTAGPNMTVEVFEDVDDEGQFFLGTTSSDESGNFTFPTGGYSPNDNVTATATDAAGNTSTFSAPFAAGTGVDDPGQLPVQFKLSQNFPNPFNPSTTIVLQIPTKERAMLAVYDLRGRRIDTLMDRDLAAGLYEVTWAPDNLASGMYLIQLKAGSYREMIKVIYQK